MEQNKGIQKIGKEDAKHLAKTLTDDQWKVCQALYRYNQIKRFPLSDVEIMNWKDTLFDLFPNLDPAGIMFVVNKMITGEIECDLGGIHNITKALTKIDFDDVKGYIVKSDQTY